MADLSKELLPRLEEHRIPGLELGNGFIYPNYAGQSILNIPSSICRLLGAPELGAPALIPEILSPLEGDTRCVILVLLDALALHRMQRWMNDGNASPWQRLAEKGVLAPLTSITPSTTSAALTSLWTGRSAAEHGIVGYEMWLKEYGLVANTIFHAPMSFKNDAGSLAKAGFTPQAFMPLPTLGAHLAAHGVQTYALQHYSIIDSGLSQMYFKEVTTRAFITAADLFINLRELVEKDPQAPRFIWVYWPDVDTLSHYYGPDDERTAAEFASFGAALEGLFLERLSPQARQGTVLALVADHGQIATQPDPYYELRNHPGLTRRLHILPTGENRLAYLFIRPGQTEAVREYIERTWPNQFSLINPPFAVQVGLYGTGQHHPGLSDRLGDLLVVGRDHAYLWWANKENNMRGRHGGLHPEEMLVPFLAARLE
jgi:predicted AlkP superfamily pyrophosphatase or phosphodiesterase